MNHCAEIKLLAERKAGTLLKRKNLKPGRRNDSNVESKLPEGITPKESHRWQQQAKVPAKEFERYVSEKKGQ